MLMSHARRLVPPPLDCLLCHMTTPWSVVGGTGFEPVTPTMSRLRKPIHSSPQAFNRKGQPSLVIPTYPQQYFVQFSYFKELRIVTDLGTVKNRERLKPRREPYWQKLAQGQFLGFRPSTLGKGGNWTARAYDPDARKQRYHPLGAFSDRPLNDHFSGAMTAAREWFTHLNAGGTHDLITVQQSCERYAAGKPEVERRFQQYIYSDPIAKVKLHKLTDRHVRDWRKRLEALPALVTRSKKGEAQVTRTRAASTVNRDMVPFRAALNLSLAEGHALSARAWQTALTPVATHGRRNLYLDKEQRRELLKHLPEDAKAFAHGLYLLPLRPGALAELVVGDLDARRRELAIERDKAGKGRKILLSDQALAGC